ncbi:MAG TPA: hypothetical protein EYG35_01315 [Gammaproteobacteria bacterium]|nr:hypothetical protein [Gammaproteobacteria bacterium]
MFDITFQHPFTCLLVGPSGSGKTTFIYRLLKERETLIKDCPRHILFFYAEEQELYAKITNEKLVTHLIRGLPELEDLRKLVKTFRDDGGCLLIIDDALYMDSDLMESFFVQGVLH